MVEARLIIVVIVALTATLTAADDGRTNQQGFGNSMSSMAQSLGLPGNAAMSSLGQSFGLPSFLVQTLDRVTAAPPQCVAESGQEGICLLPKKCLRTGGVSLGRCSDPNTICCHRPEEETTAKCGSVVSDDEVIFRSPEYPHQQAVFGQCQVTVNARADVCQLRLDFTEFSLSPPETCGPRAGYCLDDAFSVSAGLESSVYPVLCGFNSGQHMYVDVSQTKQAILSVRLSARTEMERRWSIRITQVSCWSPNMAPEGCLQYHTNAADTITSFNFVRNPTGFHYFANLHYSICIRRQLGFCSILFEENGANGFRLSPLTNQRCRDAYVLIPTGSTGTVTEGNLGDRICGDGFTPVASNLAPFRVSFVTAPRVGYSDCPCPGQRPTPQPTRPTVATRPTRPSGPVRPPVATRPPPPIGAQNPTGLGAAPSNETLPQVRQLPVDDSLVCRAGGFSLRYVQLPHGC
ncbi:hypothetical protein V5799_018237 [Amblyomma americanum]|uniref:CUB domain-containing protein n=1 Tax=Amblyomma americanum TaxID=6943 RepID=A0AAQ4F026_AMBAM